MSGLVLDTNVLVSAIIYGGKPGHLLKKILKSHGHVLVTSYGIFTELVGVLQGPKFNMRASETAQMLDMLLSFSETAAEKSEFAVIKTDPADNMILNTAYDGRADYIVSGDLDLLRIERFKQIKIVTVIQMLRLL